MVKALIKNSMLLTMALFFLACGGSDKDSGLSYELIGETDFTETDGRLTAGDTAIKAKFGGAVDDGRYNITFSGVKLDDGGELTFYGYAKAEDLSGGIEVKFARSGTTYTVTAKLGSETSNGATLSADDFVSDDVLSASIDFQNDLTDDKSAVLIFTSAAGDDDADHTLGAGADAEFTAKASGGEQFGFSLKTGSIANKSSSISSNDARKAAAAAAGS